MSSPLYYASRRRCIYCGSCGHIEGQSRDPLTKEHIVPFFLNGDIVIPFASCAQCANVTKRVEGECARYMYGDACIRLNLNTRNPNNRPKYKNVGAIQRDRKIIRSLQVEDMIAHIPTFDLPVAGFLQGVPPNASWEGMTLATISLGARSDYAWNNAQGISHTFTTEFRPAAHARLLAKIAHCLCIQEFGADGFEHWLPPYILGERSELAYLIGGSDRSHDADTNSFYSLQWEIAEHYDGYYVVLVNIRLFSQFGGPWATVVAGKARQNLVRERIRQSE